MFKVFTPTAILAAAILAFWGIYFVPWLGQSQGLGIEKAGQFGDAFGPINALFAGLAFSGALVTLWMQQRELSSQQNQLRDSQREQHLQRFDTTFFQLLTLLRDLRSEVSIGQISGPEAFRRFYNSNLERFRINSSNQWTKSDIAATYISISKLHAENPLGPFFRIVYSILRRISEDKILTRAEKASYGNLVRSHLSTSELGLIGLNGLTEDSNDFQKYITEFRILKYMPDNELKIELERFYPPETFMARD